jgi:hypothetical protein
MGMSIGENMINGVYHMVNGTIDIPTKWECQLKIRNVNGNVIMNFQDPLYLETKQHHDGDIGMGLEMKIVVPRCSPTQFSPPKTFTLLQTGKDSICRQCSQGTQGCPHQNLGQFMLYICVYVYTCVYIYTCKSYIYISIHTLQIYDSIIIIFYKDIYAPWHTFVDLLAVQL